MEIGTYPHGLLQLCPSAKPHSLLRAADPQPLHWGLIGASSGTAATLTCQDTLQPALACSVAPGTGWSWPSFGGTRGNGGSPILQLHRWGCHRGKAGTALLAPVALVEQVWCSAWAGWQSQGWCQGCRQGSGGKVVVELPAIPAQPVTQPQAGWVAGAL